MDYWTENQGHLPQYNKFSTFPSRSYAQNYRDRPPPPQYQEQRAKTVAPGYHWPPRDVTNWSNQESTAPSSPSHFPFNLDHRIPHHQGEQRQELQDWTTYQHQDRGRTYNPVHYKRELSKKNDNSFRELEAWALRYSHSLPRRRRIEAELRGAMQDNVERREMQVANVQESILRGRASRQQATNYYQSAPQSQNLEVKDKISYQTKLYNHPPNYNAPPPYSVQYRNVLTQQTLAKQSYEWPQVVKKTEKERCENYLAKVVTKGQSEKKRSSSDAAKVIEGRKFQLNKKAGGMTIFCLVSRIADTEPEHVPISRKLNEASGVSEPSKVADEVDFKIQTCTKQAKSPYSKLQAIPKSLPKMADKNAQKSNDVAAIGRLAATFPLWRQPSFTSSVDADSAFSKHIFESNLQENHSKSGPESQKVGTKDDEATLMIDTMCVLVKMESLKAPKKEQVHFLISEDQTKAEQTLANDAAQCNDDISAKQQDTGQTEDFDMLAAQAKGKHVVEGTIREDFLPTNSETSEERAKRICGLRESTMAQQEDHLDFAVEDLPKQNAVTNEFDSECLYQRESINASSISQDEKTLLVSSCKDEETKRSKEIGEVDEPEENIMEENVNDFEKDNEVQKFKMAESLEQETNVEVRRGQCKESVDKNILQTPTENTLLQRHLEDVPSKLPESEVGDDAEDFSKHEKGATQPIVTPAKVQNLSEYTVGLLQQEVKKEVSEGSSDPVERIKTCNVSEEKRPVSIGNEKDFTSSELETHEEPFVHATSIKTWQRLYGGKIEEAPALAKSENEKNQCVKLAELCGCNMAECKSDPKVISRIEEVDGGEDMEGFTSDLEIQEKEIETMNEKSVAIVDASTDKTQLDEKEQEQLHILVASNDNAKDFEETKHEEQFECNENDCANDAEKNVEEEVLPSANVPDNQEVEPTTLTEPHVDVLSEDVEQNTEREEENVNTVDTITLLDVQKDANDVHDANLSDFEMQTNIKLNGNTEFGQEECAILEVDHLEVSHEGGAIKYTDGFDLNEEEREQISIGATCAKLRSETADILGEVGEPVNEPEIPKDMDLKGQILGEICKIDASDCDINDFDLQQRDWEWEDGLNVKDAEKNADIVQPQVHILSPDKGIADCSLVCPPDSIVNTGVAILERPRTFAVGSEPSRPSTSLCENVCCEEEGKYPKSLWDAVNRIRKHTAPDSENEEEETTDNWDRESLVSLENVFDNFVDAFDFMRPEQCWHELTMQDDASSRCSNSSEESDGTIVDDELEETEMTNVESVEVYNEDQSSDGEEQGQNAAEKEDSMNQNQTEECPEDAEMDEDIML